MKKNYLHKLVVMLLIFTPIIGATAQEADYMNIYLQSQGSFQSISIDEIDKITFPSDDEVNITMSGVVTPMAIDNIGVITFGASDITSIEQSVNEVAEIEIISYGGEIHITSPEAIDQLQLYNMQGVLMQSHAPQVEVATLDVSAYPKGIYVVAVQSGENIVTKKIIR